MGDGTRQKAGGCGWNLSVFENEDRRGGGEAGYGEPCDPDTGCQGGYACGMMQSDDYEAQQIFDQMGWLCYEESDCNKEESGVKLVCADDEGPSSGGKGKPGRGRGEDDDDRGGGGYLDEDEAVRFYMNTQEEGELEFSVYLKHASFVRASILTIAATLAYLLY